MGCVSRLTCVCVCEHHHRLLPRALAQCGGQVGQQAHLTKAGARGIKPARRAAGGGGGAAAVGGSSSSDGQVLEAVLVLVLVVRCG